MSYTKPDFELADIAREFGDDLRDNYNLTAHQKKVLTRICQCRTAELGGHRNSAITPIVIMSGMPIMVVAIVIARNVTG